MQTFNHSIKRLFQISLVSIGLTFLTPNPTTIHAEITHETIQKTPWEITSDTHAPYLQPLDHGAIDYAITTNPHNYFYHIWQAGIQKWINLQSIPFRQVSANDTKCHLFLSGNYHKTTKKSTLDKDSDGDTNISVSSNTKPGVPTIIKSTSTLSNSIKTAPKVYQILVAEHEIGHALGFAHDHAKYFKKLYVMDSSSDYYNNVHLGTKEARALLIMYGPQLNS